MEKSTHPVYIGLDMDGVIIDHTLPKIRLAEKYGIMIAPEQTPSEIMKTLLPAEAWKELQHTLYSDPAVAFASPIMRGARPALRELVNKKVPFALISRRKDPEIAKTLLKRSGLWDAFFTEKNTFFVASPEEKNVRARELGVTHYLDDELKVLDALAQVPNRYLFDKYEAFGGRNTYQAIKSWQEFLMTLNLL